MGLDMTVYKSPAPPIDGKAVDGRKYFETTPNIRDLVREFMKQPQSQRWGYEGDPNHPESKVSEELYYWRKHPDLHGLLEKIFYEKGGKDHSDQYFPGFNCQTLELEMDDILRIEEHMNKETLPFTQGFFFGQSFLDPNEEDDKEEAEKLNEERRKTDQEFIKRAKEALNDGYYLFYYPSW